MYETIHYVRVNNGYLNFKKTWNVNQVFRYLLKHDLSQYI